MATSSPTVNFDRGLSEAIASEGMANENSIGQRLGRGETFDTMDPALRQLLAEKARTVTGDKTMLGQRDAQDFIRYGRRMPSTNTGTPTGTSSGLGTPYGSDPSMNTSQYGQGGGASGGTYTDLMTELQRYNQPTNTSEVDYYSQELARQQANIDAINARYAGLIDDAKAKGFEQEQRTRAIGNATGGLYSPRTDAKRAGVQEFTLDEVAALEAQRGAEIAALQGMASDRALQQSQFASTAAANKSRDYVQNLLQAYGLMQQDRAQQSSTALAEAGLTGRYGGAPTLDFLNYQQSLKNDQFNRYVQQEGLNLSQDELALRREQFMQPSYDFVQLDDGTYGSWNPVTGRFESQGRSTRSYGSSGGGGGYGSSGSSGYSPTALADYYARFGKYPSDEGDISTVSDLQGILTDRYFQENYPNQSPDIDNISIPNLFEYYYPSETTSSSSDYADFMDTSNQ